MCVKYKIYCDLDGVLVDFSQGYYDLTGIDLKGKHYNDEKFWDPVNKSGYDFWVNLKRTKNGKKLWKYIKKYNPDILSTPSNQIESRIGKYDWVKRELLDARLILRSADRKKDFADYNSILIDDNMNNINDWKNAGGITIYHTSARDTINQLKILGL